jgi:subtilisin family serine protease
MTTGSRSVKVAVLDTGIDTRHADLVKNIALRPDGTILGKDFHNNVPVPEDDNSHGTYCAGILGAEGDNINGIAGVNWHVSIVPVKVLDKDACGTTENIVNGIDFAIGEGGATILSNSWGGAPRSPDLEKAVQLAADQNVLFVAGAGNDNIDLDSTPFYPASLPEPNVISVGGVDGSTPQMCWGHGAQRVHLSAPGVGIVSTVLKPLFFGVLGDGTSASTAFVAGACALLQATGLHYLDIRTRLLRSSVDTRLQGASCSRGRLDLGNAVLGSSLRTDFQCP